MPIILRAPTMAVVLAGMISVPALAAPQADNTSALLLRSAKSWEAKERLDLSRKNLQKLLLVEPNSEEALYMLGRIELKDGKPEEALRHLRTLEKIAPNKPYTQDMAASYQMATQSKADLDKVRALTRAGNTKEAEALFGKIFPTTPKQGEAAIEYYRIVGSSKDGFQRAQSELGALYKKTGDSRYRFAQLELQLNRPDQIKSATLGYEALAKSDSAVPRVKETWRASLYKFPEGTEKVAAIQRFLAVYPADQEMTVLLRDVQKGLAAGQTVPPAAVAAPESVPALVPFAKPGNMKPAHDGVVAQTNSTQTVAENDPWAVPSKPVKKGKSARKLSLPPEASHTEDKLQAQTSESISPADDPDIIARTEALDAIQDGNLDVAEASLTELIKRRPGDPEVIGGFGFIRLEQRKHDEAEVFFKQALEAAKVSQGQTVRWERLIEAAGFWKYATEAKALLKEKKLAEAESAIQKGIALKPNEPHGLAVLGNIKLAQNNPTEAERLYREVLKQEKDDVYTLVGLIELLIQTDRSAEALQELERLLRDPVLWRKDPAGQARLLRSEAGIYLSMGRTGSAIRALEQAIQLDPKNPWPRFELARLYIKLGLTPLGKMVVNEGVTLDPKNAEMRYVQAMVLAPLDDYEAVLETLNQIPAAEQTESMQALRSRALTRQAESKFALGDRKEAMKMMATAESLAKGNPSATEQIAYAWARMGQKKQGLDVMRKLPRPWALSTQIVFASLLNGARKDGELAEYLPSIQIPAGSDETNQEYRETIREIEFEMASRHFDKLMSEGKTEQAQQLANTVLEANDLSNAEYFKRHREHFSKARLPENAISLLRNEKANAPDDLELRWDLASAYAQDKQNRAAQQELRELLAMLKTDDYDRRLRIAKLQQRVGDIDGSRRTMNALIERFPKKADVYLHAGYLARSEGRYDKAVSYFEEAKSVARAPKAESASPENKPTLAEPTKRSSDILLDLLPLKPIQFGSARAVGLMTGKSPGSLSETTRIYRSSSASEPVKDNGLFDETTILANEAIADLSARRAVKVEIGLDIQSKQASNGTSTYNATEIPMAVRFPIGYEAKGLFQVDKVDIDPGVLPSAFADAALYGTVQAQQWVPAQPITTRSSGTSVALGYEQDAFKVDVGMVGMGFPVSHLVGGLRVGGDIGRFNYSLNLSRRPVTGSQLSYAGIKDPLSGIVRGGVTNTGVSLYLSTELRNDIDLSMLASYGLLRGWNVENNDRTYLRLALDRNLSRTEDMVFNLGVGGNFTSYAKNQSGYTFGHGGYYSPQSSFSLVAPLEMYGRDDTLSYLAKAQVSYAMSQEDPAVFYPTDRALQALAAAGPLFPPGYSGQAVYPGGTGSGVGYGLLVMLENRVTPELTVGGRFSMERSAYYAPNALLLYLRYSFTPETGPVNIRPQPVVPYSQF